METITRTPGILIIDSIDDLLPGDFVVAGDHKSVYVQDTYGYEKLDHLVDAWGGTGWRKTFRYAIRPEFQPNTFVTVGDGKAQWRVVVGHSSGAYLLEIPVKLRAGTFGKATRERRIPAAQAHLLKAVA